MLAKLCSVCWTSVPVFAAEMIALAVHQVVWARLFSWKWWVSGIQPLREGKVDISASGNTGTG